MFTLSDEVIEIVDSYSYFGLAMNYNGSFVKARSKLIDQARRALFAVYKGIKTTYSSRFTIEIISQSS